MHWSERRATRAAQKVPANWVDQMQELRLRLAWYIKEYDIPPELIINFDQTNIVYSHGSSTTWAPTGSKQVAVVGLEEKRAFTVVVGVTCAGQAVPFQVIYKGATTASVPSPAATSYTDCRNLGFRFLPSGTETYWASFETMVMYLRDIIEPFVSRAKEKLGLPDEQKTILLMDAWAVHRSRQFLDHLASNYPNFLPAFVPAGCTGYSQPPGLPKRFTAQRCCGSMICSMI
ncbi:hypothetical protein M407DRAFT_16027 [Tulasnella calospora MUT 4182]|uniref:DDE-1 domain-containing protein n=1 Tax=Tulasnella calospora MUT 4182 TaxID=1051891 RepID=A0A0C3KF71_9AGAM|nr:hypothetical protein M407DRAFT_16027 [Tulasnella calospora MUT 4182]